MKRVKTIQISTLMLSVVFIILGVFRNETATMINKAIHICLECVGIG